MPEIPKSDLHPSWVHEDANENFACSVMGGIDTKVNANSEEKVYDPNAVRRVSLRRKPTLDEIVKGVGEGNRVMLSKAITLIESNAPKDFDKAQRVLQGLLPKQARRCASELPVCPAQARVRLLRPLGSCCAAWATKWPFWPLTLPVL